MHRVGIGGRMHGDGGDAHFAAGALDAQRDLAAVGDEDLLEHFRIIQDHQRLAVFHRLRRGDQHICADGAGPRRLDLVERLHRLDQQQRLPGGDVWPTLTKGGAPGSGAR